MLLSFTLCLPCHPANADGLGVPTPNQFKLADGFEVDLIHEVSEGSWVSLTTDPQGRLIACDQYGGLFRIAIDDAGNANVEKLESQIQGAQGLLCAFGSLYANVNSDQIPAGVWRLTDTDGDDQYDKQEHLIELNAAGEHGPHALIVSPDGKRIVMCAGNNTHLPKQIDTSRVPRVWDEDHLLGRMPDARGHNANRLAPGGFIASFDPDGSNVELIATGFRNEYDIALNKDGELFAYDADMEWDVGTPWYRPTRINHVISGAEFGWRNGTGKWPAHYPDSFGAAVNIGPGSPTGICFGYDAKFPKKYQDALFICDWSYGNIHAVHLTEDGSTYGGTYETFATAAPLPVTDIVIRPNDGAMYFTIGGRRTQSGLYRITYTGDINEEEATGATDQGQALRELRQKLEALHVADAPANNLDFILDSLSHEDRAIRFAARIALEHVDVDQWRQRVSSIDSATARIHAVIALARHGEAADQATATKALTSIDWNELDSDQRIALLRAYGLVAMRLGQFNTDQRKTILAQLDNQFPTGDDSVDRELAQVLVYLESQTATGKIVSLMKSSPSQESQMHYAMTLRSASAGWNDKDRKTYFSWFAELQKSRGGMSFGGFIENIKNEALANVPGDIKAEIEAIIAESEKASAEPAPSRPLVKQWTVDELATLVSEHSDKPDFDRGKSVFAAATCYKCHRMGIEGGILGPDLTSAGGRFGVKDLLTSIIEPSQVISDQYGATMFLTDDGEVVQGRVINMHEKNINVLTNMLDPSSLTVINRDSIEETRESKVSMMPSNLVDTFTAAEIADLIAYLRAGGRREHPIYKDAVAASNGN
ncbi:c-type cytochrome [Rubripirellula amarantea]|nr:c-type cytochrome [Rubripirellula amarantea]